MWNVSEKWKAAIGKSHTADAYVDLYRGDDIIKGEIGVKSGVVNVDSGSQIRRRCDLIFEPNDEVLDMLSGIIPPDGGMWPLGNELQVYDGIIFPDGTREYVPQGRFRISKPTIQERDAEILVTVQGFDRSRAVSRARFIQPYLIQQGTNYPEAIKQLLISRLPTLVDSNFNFISSNYSTPSLVFIDEDDPWRSALNMASSIGCELFFDGIGNVILQPEPDLRFDPITKIYDSTQVTIPRNTMLSATRDLDDEQAYNGVVVISENTDISEPIQAVSWDTDVNSPTYFDPALPEQSIYGPVPYFIKTQYVTTQAQADEAAEANLRKVLGVIENVQFESSADPAHQGGDVVQIETDKSKVTGNFIFDNFSLTIGIGRHMMAGTRKRRHES